MQAGKLRHRITIQRPNEEQDGAGQMRVTSWSPIAERISAEVLPDRAGEFFAARQIQATTNAMIRIRYRRGIDEDSAPRTQLRVVHHVRAGVDEYWEVQGIVHFQSRFEELRLMCVRRDAEGFRRGEDLTNG